MKKPEHKKAVIACFCFLPLLSTTFSANIQAAGVEVGDPSILRNLVPAEALERDANRQYHALLEQAQREQRLAPETHPELRRLRTIANRLIPHARRFHPEAQNWRWEVNLIASKEANAFCMPGGKIAFYTGLVQGLRLTEEEIAIVMGHEIAHALREHARERIAKTRLTALGANLLGQIVGEGQYAGAFQFGGQMLTLKFSRDDEQEADLVGLEIAARAGYDPRAGISLWKKMSGNKSGGGLASLAGYFSTHPAGKNRIKEIESHLPDVMPLYEQAVQGAEIRR